METDCLQEEFAGVFRLKTIFGDELSARLLFDLCTNAIKTYEHAKAMIAIRPDETCQVCVFT